MQNAGYSNWPFHVEHTVDFCRLRGSNQQENRPQTTTACPRDRPNALKISDPDAWHLRYHVLARITVTNPGVNFASPFITCVKVFFFTRVPGETPNGRYKPSPRLVVSGPNPD